MGGECVSKTEFDCGMVPLNSWDKIIDGIISLRAESSVESKINTVISLLVNIRLLDKEGRIQDDRDIKGNVDVMHRRILDETRLTVNASKEITDEYVYFVRELLKKLPVRSGSVDLVGDIRSAAEYFEEGRDSGDPVHSFAGDLRKEVHRKLSPHILGRYIHPYLEMARNGNVEPMRQSGYLALASAFEAKLEDESFVALAEELKEKLSYLWDYEKGDITVVKENLRSNLDLFERCFLRVEMETFLDLSSAERIRDTHNLVDCLKRLASFKMFLKKSYYEKRIDLFDFLNLDLDLGRLIFIFTNDLTNSHYEVVSYKNVQECISLVKELTGLLSLKGIVPKTGDNLIRALNEMSSIEAFDILKTKRALQNAAIELQQFMQHNIFHKVGQTLNNVLEAHKVATSSLSAIKGRFFNNFIRTTLFHVVNEFVEKIIEFLDREIASKNAERSLYGKYRITDIPFIDGNHTDYIATTWSETPSWKRPFLGGKGNGIIDMSNIGINVPPAFILGLPICKDVLGETPDWPGFRNAVKLCLNQLEEKTGKKFGDPRCPLFVSVRSGAMVSLPGSMCTILNVGITPDMLPALAGEFGGAFSSSIYLRFLENTLAALEGRSVSRRPDETEDIDDLIKISTTSVQKLLGESFLLDPFEQLVKCVELVFASSQSPSVKEYLEELSIGQVFGTAVTVQKMVFGNKNANCLSGVAFTRNPINGSNELFGEFKEMTQGEDIVMDNVITRPITAMPASIRDELFRYKEILEWELKHEMDIEFTVEDGVLYLLQNRRATISTYAKLVVDKDMMKRGIISYREFMERVERLCANNSYISVPREGERYQEWKPPLCKGVPINNGITVGSLVLTPEKFEELRQNRENVVYFAQNTKPSDFYLINNASGIVTIFTGRTSHAAITSITLNKPCMVGCANAVINLQQKTVTFRGESDVVLREGELVTLDANSGYLYRGVVPVSNSFIKTNDIFDSIRDLSFPIAAAEEVERIIREKIAVLKLETGLTKKVVTEVCEDKLVNRRVLVRLDLNVPFLCGEITDTVRIDSAVPTIAYLLQAGATPILCSHFGEPDKQEKKGKSREEIYFQYSLKPVAEYLRSRFPELVFHEDSIASSGVLIKREDIVKGHVNILENLRFAIGEKENDPVFARGLAALADGIFVNDAFGTCHRRHASITGVTRYVDTKLAGLLVDKELKYLGRAISEPMRPFVGITGGSKISTKLGIIESLLQKIDVLIVGGGIGYTFLKASGFDVQKSLVEESMLETAKKLLDKYGEKIVLPRDFVITDEFDFAKQKVGNVERNVTVIKPGWESFDLGDQSLDHAFEILRGAKTVLWNGPIGAFEIKEGAAGTIRLSLELANLAEQGVTVIIGGGDSASAVKVAGVAERMTHVSTGGGASLEFLERLTLPGISVLDPS